MNTKQGINEIWFSTLQFTNKIQQCKVLTYTAQYNTIESATVLQLAIVYYISIIFQCYKVRHVSLSNHFIHYLFVISIKYVFVIVQSVRPGGYKAKKRTEKSNHLFNSSNEVVTPFYCLFLLLWFLHLALSCLTMLTAISYLHLFVQCSNITSNYPIPFFTVYMRMSKH